MSEREYNKDEKSLLLYFEHCLVDTGGSSRNKSIGWGEFDPEKVNKEDIEIGNKLTDEGLILFRYPACIVRFTDKAWKLAHKFRRERAERHSPTLEEKEILVDAKESEDVNNG